MKYSALIIVFLLQANNVWADPVCGSIANHYGPYDYSNPQHRAEFLPIVERAHFTPRVQYLEGGHTADLPINDLDYTLKTFPNHILALHSMARYQLMHGLPKNSKFYTIECYFDRAVRFKPDDGAVYLVWGYYLHKKGRLKEALQKYEYAEKLLGKTTMDLDYNMGLVLSDLKQYDRALEHAKRAYAAGYPLTGLKQKLQSAGKWQD